MLGDGLDTRDAEHDGLQLKACALEAMRFEPEHARQETGVPRRVCVLFVAPRFRDAASRCSQNKMSIIQMCEV